MSSRNGRHRAAIFGCASTSLSDAERRLFADADPLGFILFKRNCTDPGQVRALTAELRESVGRRDAPILIDQEGGRVARLRPPHWSELPRAASLGSLYAADRTAGLKTAWLLGRVTASELADLGIDVNCAPVLDVLAPAAASDIIGDRAYGSDPADVAALGRAYRNGMAAGGVLAVVKHIPGHGRADADSHFELPVVRASAAQLEAVDLVPFRELADSPMAMTAHVLYPAWDPDRPATTSEIIVREIIRGRIGFDGLLLSDDLSMQALDGSLAERTAASLGAGCDVVLHCNGRIDEMA